MTAMDVAAAPQDAPDGAGFLLTVRQTLDFLADRVPMGLWMFTRVDGDHRVVIDAVGDAFPVAGGSVLGWSASICHRMVTSDAPRVVNDIRSVEVYDGVPDIRTFGIQRYSGWPVAAEGRLFGTLCGIDPHPGAQDLASVEPLIAYAGTMLTAALTADLERDRLQRRLDLAELASLTDSLTGLANRRAFDMVLTVEQARTRRYGHTAAVAVIDLNHLKVVNDTHGHARGDALIGQASDVLRSTVRASDTAFRIGGDEFAVIATPCRADEAEVLEDRLRAAFRDAGVGAAIGLAVQAPGRPLTEVVPVADARMYLDKRRMSEALQDPG